MADYYRDVIRLLRAGGYEFKREGRGDHENLVESANWRPRDGRSKTAIEIHSERDPQGSRTAQSLLAWAPGGNAVALIEIDGELPPAVLAAVRALPQVQQARPLKF